MSVVIAQKAWRQVSADYDVVEVTRTIVVTPETPIGDVMKWASEGHYLGRGDAFITETALAGKEANHD